MQTPPVLHRTAAPARFVCLDGAVSKSQALGGRKGNNGNKTAKIKGETHSGLHDGVRMCVCLFYVLTSSLPIAA